MVFQKKGATAVKNFQPKKKGKKQVEADDDDSDMLNDMEDSDDFEEDSDEDMPVQKTPQIKTPKGRQSLSEKKVTFDMFSENTPGKTRNKNNSLVGKKTPTPAKPKGALQEFKGIKGGKPQQKKGQVEEDDDDDDDDDDDEEDDDLDLEMDEDDDLDEEGEDEEEDDDDDDDDDEEDDEEEEQKPKQKQANKQKNNVEQNKQKTPVKIENAKNQTPKAKTPKNEVVSPKKETGSPKKNSETQSIELQRRRERDAKSLYVGGLPADVTAEELQTLSPDIQNIILPKNKSKNMRHAYGFLCFASEAKAEANYNTLQSKKFRGQLLNIDFVGEKSKKKPTSFEPNINERKLYVTGIPVDATIAQVAAYFPKAYQISFNKSPSFRSASINFDKIEDANEAFKSNKDVEINGSKLIVVHSTVSSMKKKNKKRPQKNKKNSNAKQGGSPAKKMKFTKQEESSDEE